MDGGVIVDSIVDGVKGKREKRKEKREKEKKSQLLLS